jgi:hypothetical protein
MYRTVEYEDKNNIFGTLPVVTDTVAALGVSTHGLWRNILMRL